MQSGVNEGDVSPTPRGSGAEGFLFGYPPAPLCGMIFSKTDADLIRRGRKSQLRIAIDGPCPLRRGRRYAVQTGFGQTATCHMMIQVVSQQRLSDILDAEVMAEGAKTRQEVMDRFEGDPMVWVVTFRLHYAEAPRLLARDSSHAYTAEPALAMTGEPESVTANELEAMALKAWRERQEDAHAHRQDAARRVGKGLATVIPINAKGRRKVWFARQQLSKETT